VLTGTVEDALAQRDKTPTALLMGEVNGLRPPGFDFGNSPSALASLDLSGRTFIQRTTAGTQGAVRATQAETLYGASFVVAAATVRSLRALQAKQVTFVVTGQHADSPGDEDQALADYLSALLIHGPVDPAPYLARVRASFAAQKFLDPHQPDFPLEDLACCLDLDHFTFAMPIERKGPLLVLKRQEI
jgi:2-phosphosulfolactate phosphatase